MRPRPVGYQSARYCGHLAWLCRARFDRLPGEIQQPADRAQQLLGPQRLGYKVTAARGQRLFAAEHGCTGRYGNDGDVPSRRFAHLTGELQAAEARHRQIGGDQIRWMLAVDGSQAICGVRFLLHLKACSRQDARHQVAVSLIIINHQDTPPRSCIARDAPLESVIWVGLDIGLEGQRDREHAALAEVTRDGYPATECLHQPVGDREPQAAPLDAAVSVGALEGLKDARKILRSDTLPGVLNLEA